MPPAVLYIDDDEDNLRLVARILGRYRAGTELLVAATGQDGVQAAIDARPGLILLDNRLPDATGADVLHRLASTEATARIPVVILSGDSGQADRRPAAGRRGGRVPGQAVHRAGTHRDRGPLRVVSRPGQDGRMRLDPGAARRLFGAAPVARLATVSPAGRPHLVPVTFVLDRQPGQPDHVYTAVDAKPKTTTRLQRLRNIQAHPQVALLADHYWRTGPGCGGCAPTARRPCWTPRPGPRSWRRCACSRRATRSTPRSPRRARSSRSGWTGGPAGPRGPA